MALRMSRGVVTRGSEGSADPPDFGKSKKLPHKNAIKSDFFENRGQIGLSDPPDFESSRRPCQGLTSTHFLGKGKSRLPKRKGGNGHEGSSQTSCPQATTSRTTARTPPSQFDNPLRVPEASVLSPQFDAPSGSPLWGPVSEVRARLEGNSHELFATSVSRCSGPKYLGYAI